MRRNTATVMKPPDDNNQEVLSCFPYFRPTLAQPAPRRPGKSVHVTVKFIQAFAHSSPKFYGGGQKCEIWLDFRPQFTIRRAGFESTQYIGNLTRSSAIAERPRCRVRYTFRQK